MPASSTSDQTEPQVYLQRDQPDGVPPLALTGERTLPDVPEENYWYQRHLIVYEWIRERVAGLKVIDMACGEGYGSSVLAGQAAEVVGVDANPEAHEHARLRKCHPPCASRATWSRPSPSRPTPSCSCRRSSTSRIRTRSWSASRRSRPTAAHPPVYVSTPNVLTLAPEGAEKSGNPWHVKEYRPEEFHALCAAHFSSVEVYGLFHARKLAVHELAIKKLRWDARPQGPAPHQALLRPVHAGDLGQGLHAHGRPAVGARAGLRGRLPPMSGGGSGRLVIVLHSHMPYVEGFGTWPFGEEWLFEAAATVYVPLLELLEGERRPPTRRR